MAPTVSATTGQPDFVLPAAPPLVAPPLALVDLARPLFDLEGETAQATEANEKAASAQAKASAIYQRMQGSDHAAEALAQLRAEYDDASDAAIHAEQWASDQAKKVADLARFEKGFTYLPELGLSATEVWAPDTRITEANLTPGTTNTKNVGLNTPAFPWYDPFVAIGRDSRSTFGWPSPAEMQTRQARAIRALRAHEPWQVEHEFWTGAKVPTNFHLSCSPNTPTTSPHRTLTGNWPNPTPASGTVLGTAVGLTQSLAALDQSIADSDGGLGMIHATPFVAQNWAKTFPLIVDHPTGRMYTVNGNLVVPGYGYPGTGPDQASRQVTDGTTTNNTANIGSATANFTGTDIGSTVTGTGIPAGAYIIAVTSSTVAVLNVNATATGSALTLVIGAGVGSLAGQRYQWAYATEMVFTIRGDIRCYPWDLNQASPSSVSYNALDERAERSWALVTNQLLRAAVLIDTQTA